MAEPAPETVDWIDGETRLFAILGDPITQVRSPEMITAAMRARGANAVLFPAHAPRERFETVARGLMALENLDGLIFTIPFKTPALALAGALGEQAQIVGALNALARGPDGRWTGEMFDGLGCVAGLRAMGHELAGRRLHLMGAGGAGSAIGVAVAFERPALLRIHEPDVARAEALAARVGRVDPRLAVELAPADPAAADVVLNASPVGMLDDPRNPLGTDDIPSDTVVFDAIVKPLETPLIRAARAAGCRVVTGREMLRGQVGRIADFFLATARRDPTP